MTWSLKFWALSLQTPEEIIDDPPEMNDDASEVPDPIPPQKKLSDSFKEYEDKELQQNESLLNSRLATVSTNIKKAMSLYESSGERGKSLEQLHTALLSVPPTSVEGHFDRV